MPPVRSAPLPERMWWLLPFAIASAVHLAVKLAGMLDADAGSKWLLMPALLVSLALGVAVRALGPSRLVAALVAAGVLLSWVGDITVENVPVGLSFFLVAHLAYIAAFWQRGHGRPSWWSLWVLPWFAGLLVLLAPTAGPLLPAIIAYGVVLAAMSVSATRVNGLTALGGALFVVSDSLLAIRLFTPELQGRPADALIMVTYLAAQLLLTIGVLGVTAPDARPATGAGGEQRPAASRPRSRP